MNTKRIAWIDNLRGFAMLLILLGHSYPPHDLKMLIYSFHVPLFFFLSGYLYKERNVVDVIKHKTKTLLKPYFITALISLPFGFIIYKLIEKNLTALFYNFFYLNGSVGWNAPIWFLIVLFWVEVGFACLSKIKTSSWFTLALTIIAGYVLYIKHIFLPFGLSIAIWELPFYELGYITKKGHLLNSFSIKIISSRISGALLVIISGIMEVIINKTIPEVYHNELGNFFYFYPIALIGITGCILLFMHSKPVKFLTKVSQESLFILCTQYFIFFGIKLAYMLLGYGDLTHANYLGSILMFLFAVFCYTIYFWILEKIQFKFAR